MRKTPTMLDSRVKHETSLAKVWEGRLKATKQVERGSSKDTGDASLVPSQSSCEQRSEKLPAKAGGVTQFVPVVSKTGKVLMPTTPCRAKQLIKEGRAKKQFRCGIFYIKMLDREDGDVQKVAVGIDPGSKREAYTVKSKSHTYLNVLSNAVDWVKDAVETRRIMRRSRRSRNTPYRMCRTNRSRKGIPPSTKARWQLKLRISNILCKLYPITDFVVEDVKAKTIKNGRKWNVSFSPLEVGKNWFYDEVRKLGELYLKSGWETKELRDTAGLKKTSGKLKEVFSAHNVDSFVIANWLIGGNVCPDNTEMFKIDPIRFHRRQLHYLQPSIGNFRKRYGSTISLGIKKGSLVTHNRRGFCYVGGNTKGRLSLHNVSNGDLVCKNSRKDDVRFLSFNSFKCYRVLGNA